MVVISRLQQHCLRLRATILVMSSTSQASGYPLRDHRHLTLAEDVRDLVKLIGLPLTGEGFFSLSTYVTGHWVDDDHLTPTNIRRFLVWERLPTAAVAHTPNRCAYLCHYAFRSREALPAGVRSVGHTTTLSGLAQIGQTPRDRRHRSGSNSPYLKSCNL